MLGKGTQRGDMVRLAHNRSRGIGFSGLLLLGALMSGLLFALVLAGSARAAGEPVVLEAPAAGPESPVGTETTSSETPTEAPKVAPSPEPTPEEAPKPASPEPTPAEAPKTMSGPESVLEAPKAAPAPEPAPAPTPAPAPIEAPTPVSGPQPVSEEAPEVVISPPGSASEETPKTTITEPVLAEAPKAPEAPKTSSLAPAILGAPAATQAAVTPASLGDEPDPPSPALVTYSSSGGGGAGGAGASSGAGAAFDGASGRITAAQQIEQLGCELSELGERTTESCTADWFTAQRVLSESPMGFGFAAVATALTDVADSPAGGPHGAPPAAAPPVSPAPSPAPSGASGSATGPPGVAVSGFLTLAGLLLFGAPRATRRLRLLCRPWRTACFVLIPERPG